MHIGVLTHNYPRFTGDFSGTFVEALCEELAAQGQRVTVWAPYDPAYRRPLNGAVTLRLYRYIWPDSLHRLGYMRTMQSDLSLRLEAYALSPALFARGVQAVWRDARRLRPDVLHAHWLLPNGFIAAVVSRRLGIPLAISVPGSDAQVARSNPLFRAMARFALRQAALLTANSAELRDAVLPLGADLNRFDMIIYGTDPNALTPSSEGVQALRRKLEIEESAVVALCVGRMAAKKGFDVFIRALADPILRTQPVIGVMVGDGDEKAGWQRLAEQLGVAARLRWVGSVPKTEIGRYYNMADFLVMPSVNRPADGLNVCVLDAMSCGKPVIGSTAAGNPLAIVHGETGLLTPEQDAVTLAAAMALLAGNPGLRARMGAAARTRIETELGWPHLAKRYIAHFERMIG
ncbi:glycosyltransferase [Caldilinea sp.]|jgi:glycosyltransferase involved in cell wall biosynthesis|uniref:glycosyltransferase n=1 Tax=Caldilinea sp. TaxID=2293560 RepID=UPI0021DB9CEE|nr:glycosyltransferase [Caldilinea sp.]GIV69019.1 MAG: glycosyl transferase family 1 [Caldilinea sp.]